MHKYCLILCFLIICSPLIGQNNRQVLSITMDLSPTEHQVTFRHKGNLLIFDQEILLKDYAETDFYGWALSVVNTHDTLDLNEVAKRFSDQHYSSLRKKIHHCFENGEVKIITSKLRRLTKVYCVTDKRNSLFFDEAYTYENPSTGEEVFNYFKVSTGCPSF